MTHLPARTDSHSAVVLQPRDIELLRLLATEFILLTRAQIHRLFSGRSIRRTNFRLRQLRMHGYVSCRFPSALLAPRIPLYYVGPRAGLALGAEPADPKFLARRRQALQLRDGALPHLLLVHSVHVAFLVAARDYPDYELLTWIPQHAPIWQTLNRYDFPLRPDGYGEIRKGQFVFRFFLELDRGSERGRALHHKLNCYLEYDRSGKFKDHFAAPTFRVLFIPPSIRRAGQLLRAMVSAPPGLFWVLPAQEFFSSPLFQPRWQCPGLDGQHPLDAVL